MDKIKKLLAKLSKKDRSTIEAIIKKLHSEDTKDLDIKKLRGPSHFFRVRKGNIRAIYLLDKSKIKIFKIDLRKEDTYKL